MLYKTKIIGGTVLVASAAVGIAVPAYAASSSPTAPSTTTPSTTTPSTNAAAKHHPRVGRGLAVLGLTPAVIAKAAGTDEAGLKAGRTANKSLTQIAASHNVTRATLLSRLDTLADAKVSKLINTELNVKPPARSGKACNTTHPKAGAGMKDGRRHHHGLRGVPGVGGDVRSLARTLKVTPNALRADLKKGQTLQQIATAHKVSTATLLAAIDKDVNAQLAKTVDRVPGAHRAPAAK